MAGPRASGVGQRGTDDPRDGLVPPGQHEQRRRADLEVHAPGRDPDPLAGARVGAQRGGARAQLRWQPHPSQRRLWPAEGQLAPPAVRPLVRHRSRSARGAIRPRRPRRSHFPVGAALHRELSPAVTRLSEYLLPTEREPPADAEALSHKLMVRAGLIRQVGAGLWSYLPAGWRVHERAVQIVREELDAIGGQEMLMPVLQPAELWQRTGRYRYAELFKLKDRRD